MAIIDHRRHLYDHYVSTHVNPTGLTHDRLHFAVLDFLPKRPDLRVLDVGCGSGDLIREAQKRGYTAFHGVDASPEQVTLAHTLGTHQVALGDAIDCLSQSPGRWDCVVMTDVLEHFDADEVTAVVEAVSRALAPGGRWVVQVPNASSPFFGHYAYGDFTHRSVFTDRSLAQLSRAHALEPIGAFRVGVPSGGGMKRRVRRAAMTPIEWAIKFAIGVQTGQVRGHVVTMNLVFVAQSPKGS